MGLRRVQVDPILHFFADLEEGQALGFDVDLLPGPRVPAGVGPVGAQLEAAEPPDFNALAPAQDRLDGTEDRVHDRFGSGDWDVLLPTQLADQIRFRHRRKLPAY